MSKFSINRRGFLAGTALLAGAAGLARPALAQSRKLVIISNRSNAEQRAALDAIAKEFGKSAGVDVSVNNIDHEANKTAIRNYLVASPPDICFWFSGERMRGFVDRGLFADITALVDKNHWRDVVPVMDATTVDGKVYGLPTAGILWGLWYRQDVFDENGWTEPKSFDDLFALSKKVQAKGMMPISLGTKEMWPAAGWFDHMNLRANGLDHHMKLMRGKIAYTDPSLKKAFDPWAEMISSGLFTRNATSYGWEQAAAALAQKRAAMMDLGGFIASAFTPEDQKQLRFASVPNLDTSIPRSEDFSVDSIHIPAKAANQDAARDFLAYFYQPDTLWRYLKPDGNLPARTDIDVSGDHIMTQSRKGLTGVSGTAQYYDRDTDPAVAQAGLKGFQEFAARPERVDNILKGIERVRARVYGAI